MKNLILACMILLGSCCACSNHATSTVDSTVDSTEVITDSVDSTAVDAVVIDSVQIENA